jgi:hypothetical protein
MILRNSSKKIRGIFGSRYPLHLLSFEKNGERRPAPEKRNKKPNSP